MHSKKLNLNKLPQTEVYDYYKIFKRIIQDWVAQLQKNPGNQKKSSGIFEMIFLRHYSHPLKRKVSIIILCIVYYVHSAKFAGTYYYYLVKSFKYAKYFSKKEKVSTFFGIQLRFQWTNQQKSLYFFLIIEVNISQSQMKYATEQSTENTKKDLVHLGIESRAFVLPRLTLELPS